MKRITILLLALSLIAAGCSKQTQKLFDLEDVPENSGFKMDDYWIWGGSIIRVDSVYHLFASRWPKTGKFPHGYKTNSEIVRASSLSPQGPFTFEEVVIGERDSAFWDSNMSHNPTIHKINDEYILFYIGSDFTTFQEKSDRLLRRVGFARAKSINGPWKRSNRPLIETESNNPAILEDSGKIWLMYRDANLRVYLASADSVDGSFTVVNDNVWPSCKLEDFYLYKSGSLVHLICEDNVGCISGEIRWGVHLTSLNEMKSWHKGEPLIAYDHKIRLTNGSKIKCKRRERPQLLIEDGKITGLITSVYDGKNSWCQLVKIKNKISVN